MSTAYSGPSRVHQLRAVQQVETERGNEDGNRQSEAAREHGIKKGAKKKLFHQRREGHAEDAEGPSFGGRAEEVVDRQFFGMRRQISQTLHGEGEHETRQHVKGNV